MKPTFRKIYNSFDENVKKSLTLRKSALTDKDIVAHEVPVEQQMSKEEYMKLCNNIRYTHSIMKDEAERRINEGAGL